MAKIILVAEKVTSTSWPLALSLRAQQHDITFITSYGETAPITDGIRFMGYFKRWSFFEALRILPSIFSYDPQVLHIIVDGKTLRGAHVALASYAKSHPMVILTTSVLHLEKRLPRTNPIRVLIQESDIVTCPSVEALAKLRGLSIRSKKQGRGILPPALDLYESSLFEQHEFEDPQAEIVAEKNWSHHLAGIPYFVVPCIEKDFVPDSAFFSRVKKIAEKNFVVLMGSNHDWPLRSRKHFERWMQQHQVGDRWMFSGSLPKNLEKQLLNECLCLILAGIQLTPEEISQIYMKAIQHETSMVLDSKQASVHAHLWQKNVNCWILNPATLDAELSDFLNKDNYRPPESAKKDLIENRHLTDSPLNELNRLYTRALAQLK